MDWGARNRKLGLCIVAAASLALAFAAPANAQDDNVLRIATAAQGEASFSFQPTVCGSDQQNWETLLYVPPMYFDEDSKLQPGIFKSWSSNDDRTVWTFEIDPRAKFSDGSPVTAEDAKGTWEIMANPQYCGRAAQYLGNIVGFQDTADANDINATMTGLKVVDDHTLEVTLAESDPVFMYRIATTHLNIINPADARELGEADFWLPENNPKFTGPYVLSDYSPDLGEATMTPNENWWMDVGPYLDAVKFQFVPDAQTAGVMVVNNQIDASQADIPTVFKDQAPGYFDHIKSIGYHTFFLRPNAAPTDDPLVRKALALSVNWNAVAKATFADVDYLPTPQPLDPEMIQDPDNKGYPYDPEAARQALADSSLWRAGKLAQVACVSARKSPLQQPCPAGCNGVLEGKSRYRKC
ncbi:ABC transporter substrate-binding protein [Devosia algicola]|uniref:ABC transporter substrate-binding protein n=1 Tax=Devosia algicola TaxID=3026418 RepID=A0ABY7YLY7_9HYPH|nr:ABC transporter substrate-binding protein [Devosia algicola]WDR02188.1 ABC transporter substrate-binding protein [Devosia algicola]